jgi:hypothetical protein
MSPICSQVYVHGAVVTEYMGSFACSDARKVITNNDSRGDV